MQLREYQAACKRTTDALEGGSHLVQMATGLGKTFTFASLDRRGERVLLLSHRDELVHQPRKYYDCSFGVEQAGERSHGETVVSASVQSLVRRLDAFHPEDFGMIITDEAHHAAAKTYKQTYAYFKPRIHIGFTATPNRGDSVRLDDVFSDIVFRRDLRWGIQNGYLCDIHCLRAEIGYDISGVATRMGDYAPKQLAEAMDRASLNDAVAEAYRKYAKGATLIFASSVHCAEEIAKRIDGAVAVTAETKNRSEIIERFTRREIPCLVNCMLFTEGTDLPLVETIILARPTQNSSLYCLDEDTEILTRNGWKKLDISVGEEVATFDLSTSEIKWSPVISTICRPVDDNETFYSIKSQSCDFRVTNKHRIVYKTRKSKMWNIDTAETVSKIRDGFKVPVSGNMKFSGVPLTDDEIRFVAWVMSDGTINKRNSSITISQSVKHEEYCREIERVLKSCGFKFGKHILRGATNFVPYREQMVFTVSYGMPRGRDKDKRGWASLSRYINKDFSLELLNNMTESQFAVLLETLNWADGNKHLPNSYVKQSLHISKGNQLFIERLQIASILRGYRASVYKDAKNRKNPIYTIHIKKQEFCYIGSAFDNRPKLSQEMHVSERCWCVETEVGTIVTRRNGKVVITGNCQMVGRGLRLHPEKDKLILIDCCGVTGKADLCTAPSLLGLSLDGVPDEQKPRIEGDLFDLPDLIARHSDSPQSWIQNIRLVELWAKKQGYNTHDLNFFKMPNGSLVLSLPQRKRFVLPAPDMLGNTTFCGATVPMQEAIDRLYRHLCACEQENVQLWDLRKAKRWGKASATDKQKQFIRRRKVPIDPESLTKLEAMQIIHRITCG